MVPVEIPAQKNLPLCRGVSAAISLGCFRVYILRDKVGFGDIKAVPHSVNRSRPFKLRHRESVSVMTKVEGNLCRQETKQKYLSSKMELSSNLIERIKQVFTADDNREIKNRIYG